MDTALELYLSGVCEWQVGPLNNLLTELRYVVIMTFDECHIHESQLFCFDVQCSPDLSCIVCEIIRCCVNTQSWPFNAFEFRFAY
jgi:hypothetical protein